jgi:hypothetical protein
MDTLNLTDEQSKNSQDEYERNAQMKSGANWFYWIAALSLVNSAVFLFGGNWSFFAGLALTQVFDAIVVELSGDQGFSIAKAITLSLDFVVAGIFALCGIFAGRIQLWAFTTGMILYALDGVLALLLGGYLSAAFHVFALFMIFRGFMAARHLKHSIVNA